MRVSLSFMHKERREIEIKIQELKIDELTLAMERDELEQEHCRIGEKYYRLKTELLRDAPERHYSESDLVSLAETVAELTAAGSCNLAMKDIVDQWKKSKE